MPSRIKEIDPHGLLEFSVVYTDYSLNHMSAKFIETMQFISSELKQVYNAKSVAIVPGGGTYGMEAVARQFANDRSVLIIRNGWFSYRWSQILETGKISSQINVLKAQQINSNDNAPFAPPEISEVLNHIKQQQPQVVFAPHVETASGIILPDSYLQAIAEAVHQYGGIFVVDCIASGAVWIDMQAIGIDVLISAPQKGWSATPCAALVMLSEYARQYIDKTTSSSFAIDLKKWLEICETYEKGGHAYHATMPTDSLVILQKMIEAAKQFSYHKLSEAQWQLGTAVRQLLQEHSFSSVAAVGFQAPGVVVSYTNQDPQLQNGSKFRQLGLQIAAGVPLKCDEAANYSTFRLGLFGLEKLSNIERTINDLSQALQAL